MKTKTYLVTNRGEGSISLVGRSRIRIPGNCVEHPIVLSAEKAQATISRLKRTYPLLKIVEKVEAVETTAPEAKEAAPKEQTSPTPESKDSAPQSAAASTPETDKPQEGAVTRGQDTATQAAQASQGGARKKQG